MTRPIVLDFVHTTEEECAVLGDLPFELRDRVRDEGLPFEILMTRRPGMVLRSELIHRTPALIVEGVLWHQGSLPTELDLQEILSRFAGTRSPKNDGSTDDRPIPVDIREAAELLLEEAGPEAEERLAQAPPNEAVRTVGGHALARVVEQCRGTDNRLVRAHCSLVTPLSIEWAILSTARTLALKKRSEPGSEHHMVWERVGVLNRVLRNIFVRRRGDGDPVDVRAYLQRFDSPTDAWWLVNLGVEIAAATRMMVGFEIVGHAMKLGKATPYRVAMVQALMQKHDFGGALEYLKGFSPREVHHA